MNYFKFLCIRIFFLNFAPKLYKYAFMIHHIHVNLAEPTDYESIKNENKDLDELIQGADFPEDYDAFDDEMLDMIP